MGTESLGGTLGVGGWVLLVVALGIALGFEFVNGFHDTANAVATVIYTKSLGPRKAVVWSGLCNFLGNFLGAHLFGMGVAFSIVHLLPVDLLIRIGSGTGMAMVLALLLAATAWNLGTWYLGLPASSTHTLVGSILGVGLANSALAGAAGRGVNWEKAGEVGLSLLISPVLGFVLAGALLRVLRKTLPDPELYRPPAGDRPPPGWIRGTLIATSTGVSLAHGANDGQKGIGLIMLILIGIMPARYALNPSFGPRQVERTVVAARELGTSLERRGVPAHAPLIRRLAEVDAILAGISATGPLSKVDRWKTRTDILEIDAGLRKLLEDKALDLSGRERALVKACRASLNEATEYAPDWVLVAVATALGFGTMVGWKRIVVTVGEKIGKGHLTYAQGASAEVVAMGTIGLAVVGGLPVSTTHVLSSGVAGTMAASGTGVQAKTVRNIALAWALTLPAAMLLSAGLYLLLRLVLR
jgi:inorganic phosphate transporter, PiT family